MANHRAAAGLLLIASLLVTVALSGADARPTERPNGQEGSVADVSPVVAKPECDEEPEPPPCESPEPPPCESAEPPPCESSPEPPPCESPEPPPCESPEPPPCDCKTSPEPPPCDCKTSPEPPPCDCKSPEPEPKPELTCNKGHGVQAGETCYSVGLGVGLTLDQFLSFNPNVDCCNLFIGQWVCLEATSSTCA